MKCTNKRNSLSEDKARWIRPLSFYEEYANGLSNIMYRKEQIRFSIIGSYSDGQKKRFMIHMAKNIFHMNHIFEDHNHGSICERERTPVPLSRKTFMKRVEMQQEIDDMLEYCDFDFDFNMDI